MMARLVVTALAGLPTVRASDDLAGLILDALPANAVTLEDGDVLVVAQKVVSKAEGRMRRLADVEPSPEARKLAARAQKDPRLVELILSESRAVLRFAPGVIVVEDRRGFVMANAGIDASNVEGGDEHVLLLPEDPDGSARALREALKARTGRDVAIVINDSFGRAWRLGTVGTAIGIAGLPGLLDLRGRPDRNGRALQTSELGLADEVAAAASLMMGQGGEGRPAVHLRGVPYAREDGSVGSLIRPREKDLFR